MEEKLNQIITLATEVKEELNKCDSESTKESSYKIEFEIDEEGRRNFIHKDIKYVEIKESIFLAKTILSKEIIEDIVEDKRYIDGAKDVIYSNDIFNNSWEDSYIRKILNDKFKDKYLDGINLDGEVRCLTKEEAEVLPEDLKETERYGYWTMSPVYWNGFAVVFRVNSDGSLVDYNVDNTNGVRPVIKLNTETL